MQLRIQLSDGETILVRGDITVSESRGRHFLLFTDSHGAQHTVYIDDVVAILPA